MKRLAINVIKIFLSSVFFLVTFGLVTDRRVTERTYRALAQVGSKMNLYFDFTRTGLYSIHLYQGWHIGSFELISDIFTSVDIWYFTSVELGGQCDDPPNFTFRFDDECLDTDITYRPIYRRQCYNRYRRIGFADMAFISWYSISANTDMPTLLNRHHISVNKHGSSYYNLSFSVRLSVCLFHISSGAYGRIETKLGRKVGTGLGTRTLVSMATFPLSWQPIKGDFYGQIRMVVG